MATITKSQNVRKTACDASLIPEDNVAMVKAINVFGGNYYKRWRIYDLALK